MSNILSKLASGIAGAFFTSYLVTNIIGYLLKKKWLNRESGFVSGTMAMTVLCAGLYGLHSLYFYGLLLVTAVTIWAILHKEPKDLRITMVVTEILIGIFFGLGAARL